jgi:hypothetical protein
MKTITSDGRVIDTPVKGEIMHHPGLPPPEQTDLLDKPVTAFRWGEGRQHTRTLTCMAGYRVFVNGEYLKRPILTLRDLTAISRADVLSIQNLGRGTLWEIENRLTRLGLHLAKVPRRDDEIGRAARARLMKVAYELQAAYNGLANNRFPERTGGALLNAIAEIRSIAGSD